MTNENNIDKLFRDKLFHRDFPYDQNHWEEAEKLIDAEERKRKNWLGGKIRKAVIVISFILALAGSFFIIKYSETEKNIQSADDFSPGEKIKKPEDSEKTAQFTESENKSKYITSQRNPDKTSEKSGHEEINQAVAGFNLQGNGSGHTEEKLSAAAEVNYLKKQTISGKEEINSIQEDVYKAAENNEVAHYKSAIPADITGQTENEQENTAIKPGTVTEELKSTILENVASKAEIITSGQAIPSDDKLTQTEGINEPDPPGKEMEQKEEMADQAPESDILMPAVITLNKEAPVAEEKNPGEISGEETKIPLKDRLNWLRHVSVGISGGANISQGFVNTGISRAGVSVKPSGGIRIAYQLNEQVDIESGLLYNNRSGLNSSITVLTSRDIGKNIAHYSTTTALSLSYIDLPVHLTYKYGKHSFIVGMQYSQLMNTHNEIIDTKEENGNTAVEQTTKQWAKNDGRFSSFDLAGIFGYEYAVTERLKICGRYNYGLFDVTDDNSFGNSVRDKNNQFRIMVDYRFMKY